MNQFQPIFNNKDEYFNNKDEYFNKELIILPSECNITVQCYYNESILNQKENVRDAILTIFRDFFEKFPDFKSTNKDNKKVEIFKIYIFSNREDFQKLGDKFLKFGKKFAAEASAGTRYRGTKQVHSEIFVYQENEPDSNYLFVDNLRHEIARSLSSCAINGSISCFPKFLSEGIAAYFENNRSLTNFTPEQSANLTYEQLVKLGYSEDKEKHNLLYQAGHAVVSYLQAKRPGLIDNYLTLHCEANKKFLIYSAKKKLKKATKLLEKALSDTNGMTMWLRKHSKESLKSNQKTGGTVGQSQPLSVTLTEEEYFNRNFTVSSLNNIEVQCYYNNLPPEQIEENKKAILAIFEDFFVKFPEAKNSSKKLETFKIYIFNNKEDFQSLNSKFEKQLVEGSAGFTVYLGTQQVHNKIFIYQRNKSELKYLFVDTLRHEIAHALTDYTTNGNSSYFSTFIYEGIANYFQKNYPLANFTPEQSAKFTYEELVKLSYSEDKEQHYLLYQAGHAIVTYLQERHPKLINQYLIFHREANNQPLLREERLAQAEAILRGVLWDHKKIEAWLRERTKKSIENRQKNEIPSTLIQQTAGCNHFDTNLSGSSPVAPRLRTQRRGNHPNLPKSQLPLLQRSSSRKI